MRGPANHTTVRYGVFAFEFHNKSGTETRHPQLNRMLTIIQVRQEQVYKFYWHYNSSPFSKGIFSEAATHKAIHMRCALLVH